MKKAILAFLKQVKNGSIEIYNEFSLQHELGIFLRNHFPNYRIQFERNTKFFGIETTTKHEIDIVIYNEYEKMAIELKFPLNGQYPEQMFSFIKDICFMEELKTNGFTHTYCLCIIKDKNFYTGKKQDGIYSYFRCQKELHGIVAKPTGTKNESLFVHGTYHIHWHNIETQSPMKYYFIDMM